MPCITPPADGGGSTRIELGLGLAAGAHAHGRAAQDGQLDQYIDRLRFAAVELLTRLSRRFPRKRQGTIFLVTNLTHVAQARAQALPPDPAL